MKKRVLLIPVCILALLLGGFLLTGHSRRDEISDIYAQQIYVDEDSMEDVWINSSDTVYNWVHRSLDFSIGVNSRKTENASVVFVMTSDKKQSFSITTGMKKMKTDGETIFTASVPYRKLSEGTWAISAYLQNSAHRKIPLRNENLSDNTFAICTFRVR